MISTLLIGSLLMSSAWAINNGLGRTPAMGWNSWNFFECQINETIVREIADAFISTGLKKHGYEYVNIDDCWAGDRDSQGRIQFDSKGWPSGPFALTEYIHSLGLKAGIYSDAGKTTCVGRPGSLGHEVYDALSYAAWGFDYLKYDNCDNQGIPSVKRYQPMSDALNATGRPILFSVCDWQDKAATWAPALGNSWRTWDDIRADFNIVMRNLMVNDEWYPQAGPGQFNDPDMIEVGNGMTYDEDVSHFSLWCLIKSPLILGNDLRSMSQQTLDILTNDELIAINQDPLGVQGHRVNITDDVLDVWAGPLSDGSIAVVLLNRGNTTADITVHWSDIGLSASTKAVVRDLWLHQNIGQFTGSYTAKAIRTHASITLSITPPSNTVLAAF